MRIKSLPENERPLEKLLNRGAATLSNAELLGLIINTGTKDKSSIRLAEELLAICDSGLSSLPLLDIRDFMSIKGIGPGKAGRLIATVELGKRISTSRTEITANVESPKDIADLFMERLRYEKREFFYTVLINAKGNLISYEHISVGELTSTIVHPRESFKAAVKKSAAAVIFVHNHPSGDPTPSQEDLMTTKRLVEVGKILGIRVLDHIIIGDGIYESLKAKGNMEEA